MHVNSVGFFLPICALKMKIKLYHFARFALHLLTHCYFHFTSNYLTKLEKEISGLAYLHFRNQCGYEVKC